MPVSQFTKELRAQRIAESQFKEGGFVAIVNHHWDRRIVGKRRIAKVHANGNFTLDSVNDQPSTQQWRPSGATAHQAGKHFRYGSSHLEPWTAQHAIEIGERRALRHREKRVAAAVRTLEKMKGQISEHMLVEVETALGLLGATEPEIVPEGFVDQG